jgi:hypothetical protein
VFLLFRMHGQHDIALAIRANGGEMKVRYLTGDH